MLKPQLPWSYGSSRKRKKCNILSYTGENLSGALIVNGKFLKGSEVKAVFFEHMTIIPDGKPCYCGKRGVYGNLLLCFCPSLRG